MSPVVAALTELRQDVISCRRCPRLVAYREEVARVRRRMYRNEVYWGRPVPGFGDPAARLLVIGLAPAAHGANRTGRMFTGDRSGDFLVAAMHRAGFASAPQSRDAGDGLLLTGAYVTAPVRCAPPGNRPLPEEFARCAAFLEREYACLASVRVILALGGIAYARTRLLISKDGAAAAPAPRFGHGVVWRPRGTRPPTVVLSYHPSQQNTQTGRLTAAMMDEVLATARALVSDRPG